MDRQDLVGVFLPPVTAIHSVLTCYSTRRPNLGISYEWNGETRQYVPDYLIKIAGATWIVEIEWQRIPMGDDDARWNATAKWVRAMNNHGRNNFGDRSRRQ